MMTINYPYLSQPFLLLPGKINILSIENPREYFNGVRRFINGKDCNIFSDGKQVSLENHCEVLLSPFHIDYSSKKIQSLLYKQIETAYSSGSFTPLMNQINSLMQKFLFELTQEVALPVTFQDQLELADILKTASVKVLSDEGAGLLLPQLIDYINILLQLKSPLLFVFIGLRGYLTPQDAIEFLQHCRYHQAQILFIESRLSSPIESYENVVILDNDLCDFIAK